MFIVGFVIFLLYMSGLLYMIKNHMMIKSKRMKNPETKNYDQNDYDGGEMEKV